MSERFNLLFLMTDQMQGRVLEPAHPCRTPNFDRLAERGIRFRRAYTPNAVCSPARASLMTGLLPHNHGVFTVTHTVDPDQCRLREDKPHWAQRLRDAGYLTGYFGKWHIERGCKLEKFGWRINGSEGSELMQRKQREIGSEEHCYLLKKEYNGPPGYRPSVFYGVVNTPPQKRGMGIVISLALDFLEDALKKSEPWCCFVSVSEPHDPYVVGKEAFELYNPEEIELSPSLEDDLEERPAIYRKARKVWEGMTREDHIYASLCYYASITEIDYQFARIIEKIEEARQLERTIVILTTDHGELLGAHGLYCKNFSASEEIYNVPLIISGPGIAGGVTGARVGLHDLCQTILELFGLPLIETEDSRSFAPLLEKPAACESEFTKGFAEFFGTRMLLTQRVVWDGEWKFVFNGFDFDELYNLHDDPYEMRNLALDPAYGDEVKRMCAEMWRVIRLTGDHTLLNSHYPILRVAPYGPLIQSRGD